MTTVHYLIVDADERDHTILVRYFTDLVTEADLCSERDADGAPILRVMGDGVERIASCRTDVNIGLNPAIPRGTPEFDTWVMQWAPRQWFEVLEAKLTGQLEAASPLIGATSPRLDLQVTRELQLRLDTLARMRGYDNVNSLAKYQNISDAEIAALPEDERAEVAKFRAECRYLAVLTARVWAKSYAFMADVLEQRRPVPTLAEAVAELAPLITWDGMQTSAQEPQA